MDNKLQPIWKYPYNKLSDILVPLSIVEKQIQSIENIDSFHFDIKIKNNKKYTKDDLYVIPYPYLLGVLDEHPEIKTDIIPDDIREEIEQRMLRYYNFAIDKETLNKIDNDPNLCSIINIYNGVMATFDRNEIEELVPLTIPYELPYMISDLWNIHNDVKTNEFYSMINELLKEYKNEDESNDEDDLIGNYINYIRKANIEYRLNGEKYMIVYQLVRIKNSINTIGDNDCIWASGTTEALHNAKECMEINSNTLMLYHQKCKVILVK